MSYLFHADVFLPPRFARPVFEGRLNYPRHAREASHDDRYGAINLPEFFSADCARCIEVEYDECRDKVVKQVWRQKLDEKRDLVLVINPDGRVRTVWVNLRSDKHRTLDTTKYVRA